MRKVALTGLTAAVLVVAPAWAALPAHAVSSTIVVAQDGTDCSDTSGTTTTPYTTIQQGVDAASDGDVVLVCAGTYQEHIVTDKSLTFYGAFHNIEADQPRGGGSETVWEGANGDSALEASADNVVVNGFTMSGAASSSATPSLHLTGNNADVEDNIFDGNEVSVHAQGNGLMVQHNKFIGTEFTNKGVYVETNATNDVIQYNALADSFYDTAFEIDAPAGTTGVQVQYNTVDLSGSGSFLFMGGTEAAYIGHNTVTGNSTASEGMIMGGGNKDYTISGNTFSDFTGGPVIYFEGYFGGFDSPANDGGYISQNGFHGNLEAVETANNLPQTVPLHIIANTFIDNGAGVSPTAGNNPGVAIWDPQGAVIDATNNYWGCDTGPDTTGCAYYSEAVAGTVTVAPYLKLTGSLGASSIPQGGTTSLAATLHTNSDGDGSPEPLIDPLLSLHYAFDKGSVSPTDDGFINDGEGTVTGSSAGDGTVTVTVANSTLSLPLTVQAPPKTTLPALTIHDASTVEGNSGTHVMTFTITMSKASTKPVTFSFTTVSGTAKPGSDYVAKKGTVTIAKGKKQATITVLIKGDKVKEPNETFAVNIFNATNARIADPVGTGTIRNDD